MKELPFTSTPSDLLSARSILYSFVSAMFSSPDLQKFDLLCNTEFIKQVMASCEFIEPRLAMRAKKIFKQMDTGIKPEFMEVFGHTLSNDNSLYEMEHLKNKDVFAMTQNLADISGFYKAFGLQVDPGERADHLAVEAEFLGFILLKEALAVQNGETENAETCREAAYAFWNDHFSYWIPFLISSILQKVNYAFYFQATQFLDCFVASETRTYLEMKERLL